MDAAEVKQLKRQMADMMKALEKEKSGRQQAKAKLVLAGTSNTKNPIPQPLQTPKCGPRIGDLGQI